MDMKIEARKLQPAEGLVVRKPDGRLLPPKGELVEMSSFWQRRLNDGDVVEADAEPIKSVKK